MTVSYSTYRAAAIKLGRGAELKPLDKLSDASKAKLAEKPGRLTQAILDYVETSLDRAAKAKKPRRTVRKATAPKATPTRRNRVRRQTKATVAQSGPAPKPSRQQPKADDMISVRIAMTLIPATVAETIRQLGLAVR